MNSSFSTLSVSLLEMLSEILDMVDQLHTASIEYTVLREEGSVIGVTFTIQCLLAEQKQGNLVRIPKKDVEEGYSEVDRTY